MYKSCHGPFCSKFGCEFIGNVRKGSWYGLKYTIGDVKCGDDVTLPSKQDTPECTLPDGSVEQLSPEECTAREGSYGEPWDYSDLPEDVLEPYVELKKRYKATVPPLIQRNAQLSIELKEAVHKQLEVAALLKEEEKKSISVLKIVNSEAQAASLKAKEMYTKLKSREETSRQQYNILSDTINQQNATITTWRLQVEHLKAEQERLKAKQEEARLDAEQEASQQAQTIIEQDEKIIEQDEKITNLIQNRLIGSTLNKDRSTPPSSVPVALAPGQAPEALTGAAPPPGQAPEALTGAAPPPGKPPPHFLFDPSEKKVPSRSAPQRDLQEALKNKMGGLRSISIECSEKKEQKHCNPPCNWEPETKSCMDKKNYCGHVNKLKDSCAPNYTNCEWTGIQNRCVHNDYVNKVSCMKTPFDFEKNLKGIVGVEGIYIEGEAEPGMEVYVETVNGTLIGNTTTSGKLFRKTFGEWKILKLMQPVPDEFVTKTEHNTLSFNMKDKMPLQDGALTVTSVRKMSLFDVYQHDSFSRQSLQGKELQCKHRKCSWLRNKCIDTEPSFSENLNTLRDNLYFPSDSGSDSGSESDSESEWYVDDN